MSQSHLTDAALIVVDFQEDFCPPNGSLAVADGRDIAGPINKLLELPWALRVATQDWHPRDHVSFASNHEGTKPMQKIARQNPLNADETQAIMLCPDHCIQDTHGADLLPELNTSKIDHYVKKGQDPRVEMFSAFRDVFEDPPVVRSDLASVLHAKSVKRVFVVGLARDFCVKATAVHAVAEGFNTTMLSDATKGINDKQETLERLKDELAKRNVDYMTISQAGLL